MGQYKFSIYLQWHFGAIFWANSYEFVLCLPLIKLIYGRTKTAHGFNFSNEL